MTVDQAIAALNNLKSRGLPGDAQLLVKDSGGISLGTPVSVYDTISDLAYPAPGTVADPKAIFGY